MYFIYKLFVFLIIFLFESIVCNIGTVGNYSRKLNPETCGLSRHSLGVDTKCMKWHKDIIQPLKGAKDVTLGDAPWVALLYFIYLENGAEILGSCTGALISDQWIITNAHCMEEVFKDTITIFLGYDFTQEQPSEAHKYGSVGEYSHPNYTISSYAYDLALVKLDKPIDNWAYKYLVAPICLPERWTSGTDCEYKPTPNCQPTEYAMVAGWGNGMYPGPTKLQMGYWRIYNHRMSLSTDPDDEELRSSLPLQRIGNQMSCNGDSGNPVWQYDKGRAVLIGVMASNKHDNMGCGSAVPQPGYFDSYAMWVDQEIDWIEHIIENN